MTLIISRRGDKMAELVRVNARIGSNHNDWLDTESKRTGISKSSLIQLAVENYMMQKQSMNTFEEMLRKLNDLEDKIDDK